MGAETPRPSGPDDLAVLFQAGWDAFNRRDASAIPDLFHEDLEFRAALDQVAPQVNRGHDGIRAWWQEQWATFEEARGVPQQLIAISDHVLGIIRFEARGRASGIELARAVFQVAELCGSRILWLYHSFDAAEALRVLAERLER